jgi:hypothetical protein
MGRERERAHTSDDTAALDSLTISLCSAEFSRRESLVSLAWHCHVDPNGGVLCEANHPAPSGIDKRRRLSVLCLNLYLWTCHVYRTNPSEGDSVAYSASGSVDIILSTMAISGNVSLSTASHTPLHLTRNRRSGSFHLSSASVPRNTCTAPVLRRNM